MNPMRTDNYFQLQNARISKWLWLWLPLAYLVLHVVLQLVLPSEMMTDYISENGGIEWLQFVVISMAFVIGISCRRYIDIKVQPWLAVWLGLAILGTFYIAGEEISWGQWIFHWQTPAQWDLVNNQQETNLHNTTSWLDQKPEMLLEIGLIIGGLIMPFVLKRLQKIPAWLRLIAPSDYTIVIAVIFTLVKCLKAFSKMAGIFVMARPSEVCELYLYYFMAIYLLDLRQRLKFLR